MIKVGDPDSNDTFFSFSYSDRYGPFDGDVINDVILDVIFIPPLANRDLFELFGSFEHILGNLDFFHLIIVNLSHKLLEWLLL